MTDDVADLPGGRPVRSRELRFHGAKWDVVTDTVELDPETSVRRDVVVHPGAVGVLALDDHDRVLLIRQYRHPVATELWELPAGLLDLPGEDPLDCAARELAEEAHLHATRWELLIDAYASPGMCSELYRVYLARGVSEIPESDRHEREDEERDMPMRWVPLDDACRAVAEGRIRNALAVVGLLAACRASEAGWSTLRPATTPWPVAR